MRTLVVDEESQRNARSLRALGFLSKPIDFSLLKRHILGPSGPSL